MKQSLSKIPYIKEKGTISRAGNKHNIQRINIFQESDASLDYKQEVIGDNLHIIILGLDSFLIGVNNHASTCMSKISITSLY